MATQTTNFTATNTPIDGTTVVTSASVSTDFLNLVNDYNLQVGSNKLADESVTSAKVAQTALTSTVTNGTGFSSISTDRLYYITYGKVCFVYFEVVGTSNSTSTEITLPYNAKYTNNYGGFLCSDNGVQQTLPARLDTTASSASATIYKDHAGGTWTASGAKAIRGGFWFERE